MGRPLTPPRFEPQGREMDLDDIFTLANGDIKETGPLALQRKDNSTYRKKSRDYTAEREALCAQSEYSKINVAEVLAATEDAAQVAEKTEGAAAPVLRPSGPSTEELAIVDMKTMPSASTKTKADEAVMIPNEFIHSLVLMANRMYGEIQPTSVRINTFLEKHIESKAKEVEMGLPDHIAVYKNDEAVRAIFDKFHARLQRFFKYFTDQNPDLDITRSLHVKKSSSEIDLEEWMLMCTQCDVIGSGTSYAKMVDLFVRSNQREVNQFISGEMPDAENIKHMSLTFDDFLGALLATTGLKLEVETKKLTVSQRLEILIDDILASGPKKF